MICGPSSPFVLKFKSVSHIYLLLYASPKRTGHGSGLMESYNLHMPTNKTRLKISMEPNVIGVEDAGRLLERVLHHP